MEKQLFLRFYWYYLCVYLKSLYESYLPISTLFLILFFNNLVQDQLSTDTATVDATVISDSG